METELKLELVAEDVARLAQSMLLGGNATTLDLHATYFDTVEGDLSRAGLSLRIRQEGERRLQTVKAGGAIAAGLFVRPEWEREVAGDTPILDAGSGPLEAILRGRPVVPRFSVHVTRTRWLLERGEAHIEVALDEGTVRSSDRADAFAELELELKHGPVSALFELARELGEVVPLRLAALSKAERGFRLATAAGAVGKAEPIRLDAERTPAEAFAIIAYACLRQFRLNEKLLLAGDARPAPLHQARVGLRRLRSAFTLFKPLLRGDPRAQELAGKLRAIAGLLGDVRDLDVLAERYTGEARKRVDQARGAAYASAQARLKAPETRRLMLDLVEWIALGEWRDGAEASKHDELTEFAADLLERRRRRLKRDGKKLARLSDPDRHDVRIEAKKLRYAAEFFGGLWAGKKAARRRKEFLQAIEALQEDLGLLNDAATAPALLARLDLPAEEDRPSLNRNQVLKRAEQAHHHLMDVKPFWR